MVVGDRNETEPDSQAGERRLRIDPKCKQLILDLERVRWKTDSNGNTLLEIDKSDPYRTGAIHQPVTIERID